MKLKELKKEFFETKRGKELKLRFNRILIYSILLLGIGIYFLITALLQKEGIANYLYSFLLIGFGIGFIIARYVVIRKQVVNFGVKKKEKKSKK